MPLVTTKDILIDAKRNKYAIPAFNCENIDMAYACIEAAEDMCSPVIIATTESTNKFIPFDVFQSFIKQIAQKSKIPIALHLDHSKTKELILKALKAGYTSVMIDASHKPYIDNISITREIKSVCEVFEIPVEAELGVILAGKSFGRNQTVSLTDPETAKDFICKTDADSLAVSIGNKHGLYQSKTNLDFVRLKQINDVVEVPLVLHGGTGIADNDIQKCVKLGINKCNFGTELRIAYTKALRDELNNNTENFDPRVFLSVAKDAIKNVCISKINLMGCSNRV